MSEIGASDARERHIANMNFGGGAITVDATTVVPATWYCGLSTTTPNDDGSGFTEPVGGAYARVAVTNNRTNFPLATTVNGETTNKNGVKVTWPTPTGTWGAVSHYGWFMAATGGSPEFTNQLDAPITIKNGNTPVEFDVNALVMPWS